MIHEHYRYNYTVYAMRSWHSDILDLFITPNQLTWNTMCERLSLSLSRGSRSCRRFPFSMNVGLRLPKIRSNATSVNGSPIMGKSTGVVNCVISAIIPDKRLLQSRTRPIINTSYNYNGLGRRNEHQAKNSFADSIKIVQLKF